MAKEEKTADHNDEACCEVHMTHVTCDGKLYYIKDEDCGGCVCPGEEVVLRFDADCGCFVRIHTENRVGKKKEGESAS